MTSVEIAATIFCCLLVGALAGMALRGIIPQHQLDADTRDLMKLGVGLIGTMSALVLGLLVASTKGSYDTKRTELAQMAGNVILLDRVLAHYGAEAGDIRDALHSTLAGMVGSNAAHNNLERLGQAAPCRSRGRCFSSSISIIHSAGSCRFPTLRCEMRWQHSENSTPTDPSARARERSLMRDP